MGKRRDIEKAAVPAADDAAAEKSVEAVQALAISLANEPTAEPRLDFQIEPKIESAQTPKAEAPALEFVAAPPIAPLQPDEIRPTIEDAPVAPLAATDDNEVAASEIAPPPPRRERRFALLAASVALAAAVGAVVGALGAYGIAALAQSPAAVAVAAEPSQAADNLALREAVEKMRSEIAALKASVDSASGSTKTHFTKITERFDRIDKAQVEPSVKLNKAVETLDRIERRTDAAVPAKETTGSVPLPTPAAVAPPPPPIVPGWVLREVYRGVALIQGARFGLIEVEAGDQVPGLGRIEAVRKHDGRWVVVTSKGLVAAAR